MWVPVTTLPLQANVCAHNFGLWRGQCVVHLSLFLSCSSALSGKLQQVLRRH